MRERLSMLVSNVRPTPDPVVIEIIDQLRPPKEPAQGTLRLVGRHCANSIKT